MGAQSITGVGPGSAEGLTKGTERQTLGADKIIGPKIVIASQVTLSSSTQQEVWPRLEGDATDYIITWNVSNGTVATVTLTMDATATYVNLDNAAGNTIYYIVTKKGYST